MIPISVYAIEFHISFLRTEVRGDFNIQAMEPNIFRMLFSIKKNMML